MKPTKQEVIALIKALKDKGYSHEQLAVMLERTQQTIWRWSSNSLQQINSIPSKSDWEVLKHLLNK